MAEAVHGDDPVFRADRFAAKYGKLPDWGRRDRWRSYVTEPSLLAVFFVDSVMPEDLRRRLTTFVPKPEEVSLQPAGEPPEKVAQIVKYWDPDTRKSETVTNEIPVLRREMERAAIHDLQAVLHLIDTGKVAVSDKTRLPGKATVKAVTALLLDGDFYDDAVLSVERDQYYAEVGPIRAFAWPLLVQAGGLAALGGKSLSLTRAGRKALGEPPEKTLRTLWTKWQKTTLLDELTRIDCIKGQTGKGKRGLTAVRGRRQAIETALRDCEPGAWTTVNNFFNYMVASGIDFEVTRNPWELYVAEPHYGSLGYEGFHNWTTLQGRYTLCLLFEYAATPGSDRCRLPSSPRRPPGLPSHLGHGRPGLLQPLRRSAVLPADAAGRVLSGSDGQLSAGRPRAEGGPAGAAQPGGGRRRRAAQPGRRAAAEQTPRGDGYN